MRSSHRRHRADETQTGIVVGLRAIGCRVACIGEPCDLLVQRAGRNYLLDCDGVTRYRRREPEQLKAFAQWGVTIVATLDQALRAVGAIT